MQIYDIKDVDIGVDGYRGDFTIKPKAFHFLG